MKKIQAAIHPDDDLHYSKLGLTRNKVEIWEDGMRTDGSKSGGASIPAVRREKTGDLLLFQDFHCGG